MLMLFIQTRNNDFFYVFESCSADDSRLFLDAGVWEFISHYVPGLFAK